MDVICNIIIKVILQQIQPSICQVKYKNNVSFGCLCKILLQNGEIYIPVLLASLELFEDKESIKNETIEIYNKNDYINIIIDDSRISYSNKDYNVIFIEIKEKDELDPNLFLQLNIEILKKHKALYNICVNMDQDVFEIKLSKTFANIIK